MALSPTVFYSEVLALGQTRFTQPSPKGCHTIGVGLRRTRTQETDHRHSRLLRVCSKRPCCDRPAEERDEFSPPQMIGWHSVLRQPGLKARTTGMARSAHLPPSRISELY